MSTAQRIIRYFAIGLAVLITVSIISGAIALVSMISGGFGGREKPDEELKYAESFGNEPLTSLKLEIGATSLTVKEGEPAVKTNNPDISWSLKDGTLTVKEKKRNVSFGNNYSYDLEIYIPQGTELDVVDIVAGVGEISISSLTMNTLRLVLGIGEADLSLSIKEGADIDCGIGKMSLTLLGGRDDYTLTVSKGIGEMTVDEKQLRNDTTVGDGDAKIQINGGIGDITVEFE